MIKRLLLNNRLTSFLMRRLVSLFVCFFLVVATAAQASSEDAVQTVIATLQNTLIESSVVSALEQRVELIQPVVQSTHDFSAIARLVTGRHWRKLSEPQRDQFIDVFTKLSVLRYAERFKDLGDSEFQIIETIPQPRNSLKVLTVLELDSDASLAELSSKSALNFEYILRSVSVGTASSDTQTDVWKIINVVVDGVSDLALKRANYVTTINEQGFDTLIEQLRGELADARAK